MSGCRVGEVSTSTNVRTLIFRLKSSLFFVNRSLSFFRMAEAKKMRRPNGKDEGRGGKDLQVLQNEYKHMQVNRNAFANESELVRMNDFNRHYIVSLSPQPSTYQLIRYTRLFFSPFCRSYANSKRL